MGAVFCVRVTVKAGGEPIMDSVKCNTDRLKAAP
jgi:hypothetical protein